MTRAFVAALLVAGVVACGGESSDPAPEVEVPSTATPESPLSAQATHGEATHAEATHAEATHAEATHAEATHAEATHAEATHAEATPSEATHAEATPPADVPTEVVAEDTSAETALPAAGAGSTQVPPPPTDARNIPAAPPGGASEPAARQALAEAEATRLEGVIAELQALLRGELSGAVDPRTLFEADLDDEAAVAARRRELEARFAELDANDALRSDEGAGAPSDAGADAGPSDVGVDGHIDVSADTGRQPTKGITGMRAQPVADAGVDAGAPDAGTRTEAPPPVDTVTLETEARLVSLRETRDRLRLQFLQLPSGDRQRLMHTLQANAALTARAEVAEAAESAAREESRRASAASLEAAAAARSASSALERSVAEGRAELEQTRADIADAVADAAVARREDITSEQHRLELVHEIQTALREEVDEETANGFYERLVAVLIATRRDLRQALDEDLADALPAPPQLDLDVADRLAEPLAEVRGIRAQAASDLEDLDRERIDALVTALHEGNELRLDLLDHVAGTKRRALVGFGEEGRAQLKREVGQLQLMSWATARNVAHEAPGWPAAAWALATGPDSRGSLALVLLALGAAMFVHRRRKVFLASGEARLRERFDNPRTRAAVLAWWHRIEAGAAPLIVIVGAIVVFYLWAQVRTSAEMEVLRTLVLAWACYRLFVRLLHHELTSRSLHLGAERSARVQRDVQRIGRFLLATVIMLGAASRIVGEGTLYTHLKRVLWVVAFVLAMVIMKRWFEALRATYLERHSKGRLSTMLVGAEGVRRYPLGFAASGVLAVEMGRESLQSLFSRFTAGRKALALLSQRKIAEAEEPVERSVLQPRVIEACSLKAADPGSTIAHFPRLDEVSANAADGSAIAVVGEVGAGKTTWLRELASRHEGSQLLDIPGGAHTARRLCLWLSESLGVAHCETPDEVAQALLDSNVSGVVCLDQGQNLLLRCIGGTEGFKALGNIVGRTQHRIGWVCTFSQHAWLYLRSAENGQTMFEEIVELRGWPDKLVEELIDARMDSVGVKANFEDLLDTSAEGAARARALVRAEEEYFRLLWHYTDGNPRLALHFWTRSITSEGPDMVRVRLFVAPDGDVLEALHEESRFVLAAVVMHENLDAEELSRILRWPLTRCTALLELLRVREILESRDGRYRTTVLWFRAVVRHLKRRRLLFL